ncbi:MAG: hypothetical protein F4X64_16430 [Chloroflexi bacterium]|nr:hypothetical protein [Chloroflexota bacterium]
MVDAKPAGKWRRPENVEALLNHDAVTIPVEELPLKAIADFCREWGIKEMYSVPMELEWFEPGGPFDGTEVSMRVVYRDDAPYTMARWGMGRLLGEAIGKNAYVSTLFSPQDRGFGWRENLIMERKTPVYVE